MKEQDLQVGTQYREKTGNTFILFREYHPNGKCFVRSDGNLHFGREFVEFKNGKRIIDLVKEENDAS